MRNIFEKGDFSDFRVDQLKEAMSYIPQKGIYYGYRRIVTVFVSHKHDDLEDLKGIIGFLEKNYSVKVYIDSQDPAMPKTTSGETARRIKERIMESDKFILLATDGAVESKWCNWELGFGDAKKFDKKNIALFPMKEKGESDYFYKGKEYMEIYPCIVYRGDGDKYTTGEKIPEGYYIRTREEDEYRLMPLGLWLL